MHVFFSFLCWKHRHVGTGCILTRDTKRHLTWIPIIGSWNGHRRILYFLFIYLYSWDMQVVVVEVFLSFNHGNSRWGEINKYWILYTLAALIFPSVHFQAGSSRHDLEILYTSQRERWRQILVSLSNHNLLLTWITCISTRLIYVLKIKTLSWIILNQIIFLLCI